MTNYGSASRLIDAVSLTRKTRDGGGFFFFFSGGGGGGGSRRMGPDYCEIPRAITPRFYRFITTARQPLSKTDSTSAERAFKYPRKTLEALETVVSPAPKS